MASFAVLACWLASSRPTIRRTLRRLDAPGRLAAPEQRRGRHAEPNLHPKAPEPVADGEITAAIERGVAFLLKDQNADGSWGSPERTKDLNIIAGIGSHHSFRAAVTALCVSALIEVSAAGNGSLGRPDAVRRAIERGEDFLFRELPLVRRDDPMLIYNVWAHAYGIPALVRMHGRLPDDTARRARIEELIRDQYDRLTRYESAEGGWGYYDFGAGTQRPNSDSCSFVNATVLVAFHEAKQIGVLAAGETGPRGPSRGSIAQRKPDFSYLYGLYLRYQPDDGDQPSGWQPGPLAGLQPGPAALGRHARSPTQVLNDWLDRLIVAQRLARHGPQAADPARVALPGRRLFLLLRPLLRHPVRRALAHVGPALLPGPPGPDPALRHQEHDGSWWDYPLYNYHQQYGTAFALMSLEHCRQAETLAARNRDVGDTSNRPSRQD